MTFVYLICFLLVTVGILFMLKLTPEKITNDLMRFVSPKQTLRDKVLTAKGKKKSRKLTVELNRIRDALEQTGKGGQFTIACAASILLMIIGCVVAIMIDNAFLIPVFAIAFALIPFAYAKRTVNFYDNHIKEELETALSIITTSYVRTDDIVTAVKENVQYLKPPVKDIFAGFVAENMMISSDIKQSIRHLKEKVSNSIFDEWCDTLITSRQSNISETPPSECVKRNPRSFSHRRISRIFCCPRSRNSPSLCSRFRHISSSSTAVTSTQEIISMHSSLKNPSSISSSTPKEVLVSSSAETKDIYYR